MLVYLYYEMNTILLKNLSSLNSLRMNTQLEKINTIYV